MTDAPTGPVDWLDDLQRDEWLALSEVYPNVVDESPFHSVPEMPVRPFLTAVGLSARISSTCS